MIDGHFRGSAGGNGNSGAINFTMDGNITAQGIKPVGIFAQSSTGTGNQGNISLEITEDSMISTNASGNAIQISGGSRNNLVNKGLIQASSDLRYGSALVGGAGNESFFNQGMSKVIGDINLGAGVNLIDNQFGATLLSSGVIYVGPTGQSVLTNSGLLQSAQKYPIDMDLNGSFVQSSSGMMDFKFDFRDYLIDHLDVSSTAKLAGKFTISPLTTNLIRPGYYQRRFLKAESVIPDGLQLAIAPSAIVNYDLSYKSDSAYLDLDIDFAGFGDLNANQESIGGYLNRIQERGSTPKLSSLVSSLFALPESKDLASAYNTLSSEIYTSSFTTLKFALGKFMDSMMSCSRPNTKTIVMAEGECVWAVGTGSRYAGHGSFDYFGFDSTSEGFSSGLQLDLGDRVYLGFSGGRSSHRSTITSSPGSKRTVSAGLVGSSWQGGFTLKKFFGDLRVAFSSAGGTARLNAYRNHVFPARSSAKGVQEIDFFGADLRASREIQIGSNSFLKPALQFAYQGLHQDRFKESGAGALNLQVSSAYQDYFAFKPSLEFGSDYRFNSIIFRPRFKLGYSRYFGSSNLMSRFQGAPSSVAPFRIHGMTEKNYFNANLGLDVIMKGGIVLSAKFDSIYSRYSQLQSGMIGVSIPF